MEIEERKIREDNRNTVMLLIPVVAVIGKLIQFYLLPDRYFYDSWRMNLMMQGRTDQGWWSGYEDTINIFNKINFFHFTNIRQWAIELGIVFTILFMILVSRVKEMSMSESIYTLAAVGLLNIYVFNLAKEPIQMSFFFFMLIIILLPIKSTFIKMIGCCLIYLWESNTFREYYIIMAAMAFVLYFIFLWLKRSKGKVGAMKIITALVLCFAAVFVFFFASQYIDADSYNEALNVRDKYSNDDASSVINNPIEVDGNFGIFMFDYVLAAVRMMVPVELLVKSPGYAPFVIYQVFILVYWIRSLVNIKKLNNQNLLALTVFTAYLFGSFVFEPDFGSWVRHEAASFPVFYLMAYRDLTERKDEDAENVKAITKSEEISYEAADV